MLLSDASGLLGAGSAYGTAKAGLGIVNVSVLRPDLMVRCSLPVIMAGLVALYGVITDIVIILNRKLSAGLGSDRSSCVDGGSQRQLSILAL